MGVGRLGAADPAPFESLLKRVTSVLMNEGEVEEIRVFGSFANGKATMASDLDVAVIVTSRGFQERLKMRRLVGEVRLPGDPGLDLLFLPQAEYEVRKDWGGICFEVHHNGNRVWRRVSEPVREEV